MFSAVFGRRAAPEFKIVRDAESIEYPVDFDAPDYPYQQAFAEADAYVRKMPMQGVVPVSDLLRLQFYSLFKQAMEGDLNEKEVKQPNMLRDWEGYWKVYGWRKCRGMPREKARDMYIDLLDVQIRKHCSFVWGAPAGEDRWAAFHDGVRIVQNLPKGGYHLPESLRAHFYALYKQATVGNLKSFQKTPEALTTKKYKWLRTRPVKAGIDQMKYDAWAALKGMDSERAKRTYCRDLFKNAAMCGYVWAPPGTADHLEVLGDQTSAKTMKMRADATKDAERIEAAKNLSVEQTMDVAGLPLSLFERVAMHSFLKKEKKAQSKAAAEAARREAAQRKAAAAKHADPSKGVVAASGAVNESTTEATATDRVTDGGRTADYYSDDDFRSACSMSASFALEDFADLVEADVRAREISAAHDAPEPTAAATPTPPTPVAEPSPEVAETPVAPATAVVPTTTTTTTSTTTATTTATKTVAPSPPTTTTTTTTVKKPTTATAAAAKGKDTAKPAATSKGTAKSSVKKGAVKK
ncbi:Acyl CoA binding protein [Novymonas esmeraldas]|uniref:Acyl CoA binding protein n=1 Tax=Novymonas esmeraldas TaxID=1808958 RepID=A0AAW0ELK7_9TRYP